jgi:hypothetical protein
MDECLIETREIDAPLWAIASSWLAVLSLSGASFAVKTSGFPRFSGKLRKLPPHPKLHGNGLSFQTYPLPNTI